MKSIICCLIVFANGNLLARQPTELDLQARQCEGPDNCQNDTGTIIIVRESSTFTVPTYAVETRSSTEAGTPPSPISPTAGPSAATPTPLFASGANWASSSMHVLWILPFIAAVGGLI